jgi:predicted DNA-binding transcriptional regulator YafY
MKTDRLLSIIIYLLNRDLVTARELADKFEVSVRTIQRDMEAIALAGIPIVTIQGPSGGYSIMDSFKLDRQYISTDDLFFIITALHSVGASLPGGQIESTIEKMKTLLPAHEGQALIQRSEKLSIDFSAFGGSERQQELFRILEKAVENRQLVTFTYTNNRMEQTERTVEPMALAFKWRSWYLFGFCRLRMDYRIFRLDRIRKPAVEDRRFRRREKNFEDFSRETGEWQKSDWVDLRLRFAPLFRPVIEEYYPVENTTIEPDGSLIVDMRMPEDGWVYGMILSYGKYAEVLAPERIRRVIKKAAEEICNLYEK